jgi:hypothetical protein
LPNTWAEIEDKLIKLLGGYISIRYEEDGNYIDYLSDFTDTSTQGVRYSINLLDLENEVKGDSLATCIIPYGAKIESEESTETEDGTTTEESTETEERVTIKSVNGGLDYIQNTEAVAKYGKIYEVVTWEDVTEPSNLLTKARAYLAQKIMLHSSLTVKAVDLNLTNSMIESFKVGDYIRVYSNPHEIDETILLRAYSVDLSKPSTFTFTLGLDRSSLIDSNNDKFSNADVKLENTKNELKDIVSSVDKGLTEKIEGIDGTYFYIKYSPYADGHVMTDQPEDDTEYMGTCSTNKTEAPTDYTEYTWVRVRGADGEDGQPGTNGSSQYFHVKYSNDGKTFTADNGEELGDWMGTCVTATEADPTDFNAYTWKKIRGEDGTSGIDGVDGQDGESCYFFVKFSANPDGNPMTENPDENTKYMGTCSTSVNEAPTDHTAYTWTQCRGDDGTNGTPGEPGADGRTQYLHIKYSDDGETFTANNGEELGAYIGTLVDFNEKDSENFDDYTWKKFTEDVDEELEDIRQTITEQTTSITNTCESIIFEALKSYTETGDFDSFKETVESELKILADQISLNFTETTEKIETVNGELQNQINTITKYFTFDINGMTIGQSDSPYKVVIDNDRYSMTVNDEEIFWVANGKVYTPEIEVTSGLKFGDYAITTDESGIVNCNYVGGE